MTERLFCKISPDQLGLVSDRKVGWLIQDNYFKKEKVGEREDC